MIDFNITNKLTDDIIINNDLIFVLQQIDLLFDTDVNDVLGDEDFGTNYDKYLYNHYILSKFIVKHFFRFFLN